LQDRLVKELRLAGISTVEAATTPHSPDEVGILSALATIMV
jgi:hypothetical protein